MILCFLIDLWMQLSAFISSAIGLLVHVVQYSTKKGRKYSLHMNHRPLINYVPDLEFKEIFGQYFVMG